MRSLFLNGPFGPVWWCDLYFWMVLLDPFGGAIFEFYLVLFWTRLVVQSLSLILLDLCDGYVGRSVITNMPIYLVHCDLRCHMWQISMANNSKNKKKTNFIWSFWTRLWCDLYPWTLVLLDPFNGTICLVVRSFERSSLVRSLSLNFIWSFFGPVW